MDKPVLLPTPHAAPNRVSGAEASAACEASDPFDAHREMLRSRCLAWNADAAHQREAGRARASAFTSASQSYAGARAFTAASARWRAEHGLWPLDDAAVKSYVSPDQIRDPIGQELPVALQRIIYDAWVAGFPNGVAFWLADAYRSEHSGDADENDADEDAGLLFPPGSLFAQPSTPDAQDTDESRVSRDESRGESLAAHVWQERGSDPGWLVCSTCWSVAICPIHLPTYANDPVFARLRLDVMVCARHAHGQGQDPAWESRQLR